MPTIADVMTADPQAADAADTILSAAKAMAEGNFGSLPVLDSGQLVGVVTDRDIAVRGVARGLDGSAALSEVMSGNPVSVAPDCGLAEAAALMQEKQIRRLYVVSDDALIGVAALADVVANASDSLAGETIEKISRG